MLTIYYKPHKKRKREAKFVKHLQKHFPEANLVEANFPIQSQFLNYLIDTQELIAYLQADQLMSLKPRIATIEVLKNCPDKLKVALKPFRISFDVVIEKEGWAYYWEFHEEQHRRLSGSRMKKVYSVEGHSIEVPRYVQRLVRDVWRVKYFRPYTIIWSNWFENQKSEYIPELTEGFCEFYLPGHFSFKQLCSIS